MACGNLSSVRSLTRRPFRCNRNPPRSLTRHFHFTLIGWTNSTTAEYAVSMGGAKDGVGTVLLGKPKGLSALTVFLHGLDVASAEIATACRVLTEQPHYEIRHGLNVTAAVLGRLRL